MLQPSILYGATSTLGHLFGIMSTRQLIEMNTHYERCLRDEISCHGLLDKMTTRAGGIDAHDVRQLRHEADTKEGVLNRFLSREDVMMQLGADPSNTQLQLCESKSYRDVSQGVIRDMLEGDDSVKKVLMYSGQFDLSVSALGMNEMLRRLPWRGREAFNNLGTTVFKVKDAMKGNMVPRGQFKTYSTLTQLILYGTGHTVLTTQPEAALAMVERFIHRDTGSLCENDSEDCTYLARRCENDCSMHGRCDYSSGKCTCEGGYSGEDCAVGEFSDLSANDTFTGMIFGRNVAFYRLQIDAPTFYTTLIDIDIAVERTSSAGNPFVLANLDIGTSAAFDAQQMRDLVKEQMDYGPHGRLLDNNNIGFKYHNLRDSSFIRLENVSVFPILQNIVTVAIYNAADLPTQYRMKLDVRPSNAEFSWSYATTALCTLGFVLLIAAEVACIVLCWRKNRQAASRNAKRNMYSALKNTDFESGVHDTGDELGSIAEDF